MLGMVKQLGICFQRITLSQLGRETAQQRFQRLGPEQSPRLEQPAYLPSPHQKNAAQRETQARAGEFLRIGHGQSRTPRTAEYMPRRYSASLSQRLQVRDEMCSRVVAQLAVGRRTAGAALIEQDDSITRRVEKPPARCRTTA